MNYYQQPQFDDNDDDMDEEEGTMILEEDYDEDYEPSQDEILEYAKYLGMDIHIDQKYIYLAKEGLKAPLPEPYKPCRNSKGDIFYINMETRQTTWNHPSDDYYKNLFNQMKQKDQQLMESTKKSQRLNEMLSRGSAVEDQNFVYSTAKKPKKQQNLIMEDSTFIQTNTQFDLSQGDFQQNGEKINIDQEIENQLEEYRQEQQLKYENKLVKMKHDLKQIKEEKREKNQENTLLMKQKIELKVNKEMKDQYRNQVQDLENKQKIKKHELEQIFIQKNEKELQMTQEQKFQVFKDHYLNELQEKSKIRMNKYKQNLMSKQKDAAQVNFIYFFDFLQ